DLFGGFGPDEGFGLFVPSVGPGADVGFEGLDRLVVAAADGLVGDEAEPAFDLVDPAGAGGGEVHVEAGVLDQPGVDRGRLVGAVVVADQVHVQVVGDFVVDLGQELLELNRSMPPVDRGDDGPVGNVERGEQVGHSVTYIVVGAPLGHPGHPGHHRQHRAGTSQGLHLALLVYAQHYRALRRIQIEADNVVDLLHEQGVRGQLE